MDGGSMLAQEYIDDAKVEERDRILGIIDEVSQAWGGKLNQDAISMLDEICEKIDI